MVSLSLSHQHINSWNYRKEIQNEIKLKKQLLLVFELIQKNFWNEAILNGAWYHLVIQIQFMDQIFNKIQNEYLNSTVLFVSFLLSV